MGVNKNIIQEKDYKLIKVTSMAFAENELIPVRFTCDGENVSPPLYFGNIPPEAVSLAIIVDDPDAPGGTFVHWLAWNIPVTHHLKENVMIGSAGMNDFKQLDYGGPCPPSGTHRYFFKVYALDTLLDLESDTDKKVVEQALHDHVIAYGELMGLYKKES